LSLIGAMRLTGWLTLATFWGAINTPRFVAWVRRRLIPRLGARRHRGHGQPRAHKARAVRDLIEAAGAEVHFLPPYSYDFNPIESGWALPRSASVPSRRRTAGTPALHRATRSACRATASLSRLVRPCWLSTQVISGLVVRLSEM